LCYLLTHFLLLHQLPFSPTSSTSAVIYTCDPQIYGPSAFLVETEKTALKIEMYPDAHVTADERDT
jgi:hypothetical protein